MRLRRPRALLVDIGNTLLREVHYDLSAGVHCLLAADDVPTRSGPESRADLTAELVAWIDRVHASNTAECLFEDWLSDQIPPDAGLSGDALAELEWRLWREIAQLEPMPDVAAGLEALSRAGIRLAAVSNAVFRAATLGAELERHGLRAALEFVMSSADEGVRKPDPRIFRRALARLGVEAAEAWFVGDSFGSDVEGAHGVGIQPVWLSERPAPRPHPVPLQVGGWSDLVARLLACDGP